MLLDTTVLTNDSTITWKRGTEPDLAGYEVVWRPTTSPTGPTSSRSATRTRTTLPLSKDNVIFGVRAVDRTGHRSPAVFPFPTA